MCKKIIYFKKEEVTFNFDNNTKSFHIFIDYKDGPFEHTFEIGKLQIGFFANVAIIDNIVIENKYIELNILPNIIDLASDISRIFGLHSILLRTDSINMDEADVIRTLSNKGFIKNTEDAYYKNIENCL